MYIARVDMDVLRSKEVQDLRINMRKSLENGSRHLRMDRFTVMVKSVPRKCGRKL